MRTSTINAAKKISEEKTAMEAIAGTDSLDIDEEESVEKGEAAIGVSTDGRVGPGKRTAGTCCRGA